MILLVYLVFDVNDVYLQGMGVLNGQGDGRDSALEHFLAIGIPSGLLG